MSPITVTVNLNGEDVVFTEPRYRQFSQLVRSSRGLIETVLQKFQANEDSEPYALLLDALEDPEIFESSVDLLTTVSNKDREFFLDLTVFTDLPILVESLIESEFAKVIQRFFTKVLRRQQTPE